MENLKYINAINSVIRARLGILLQLEKEFDGHWPRAWEYIKKEHNSKLDPDRLWDVVQKHGLDMITIFDKTYPTCLRDIPHPPPILYIKGNVGALTDGIAVVGTRKITPYGRRATAEIVDPLTRIGFTIYSGLAYGVDSVAHQAALDAKGTTVAVLPGGLDGVHPPGQEALARAVIDSGGALVSEFAPGYTTRRASYPQRNRIVSGLSKGVLVIEGDLKSGTMITAQHAFAQKRHVFAVPGPIYSPVSQGPNDLIKRGAQLVTSADDILKKYKKIIRNKKTNKEITGENETENKILKVMHNRQMTIDAIIRATQLDASTVTATLTVLEIQNKVQQINNQYAISNR